ncbi:hypothetical protein INR49_006528 [Caranx melampygus]|nr:hypothetical protein INR49_006528 [Caranx melampygus]
MENITMETITVQAIHITMETTTAQAISITMENITMETTTAQAISITMETTTAQAISITMMTTTVQAISITMETTTVQAISITMENTTVQAIHITMETTTAQAISITMENITMETTTAQAISITMETIHFHTGSQICFVVLYRKRHMSWAESCKILQEKNEGLHQSLLKTAVRMECLGEEFMSSQKVLEIELHRTRMELNNLTERFKRVWKENVTSVLHKTNLHFQSDDPINQVVLPITPPPAQFMDSHNYVKAKTSGQEQSLGSVPEEEESDWSEMGEETPRFILTGSNRGQTWRLQEGDMDKDTSLEEIPLARHHMQKELRGTEAMMDLHHPGDEATEDSDNEIIHHWRTSNNREAGIGKPIESRMSDAESSLASLHSAEQMLNHFILEPQSNEGKGQGSVEVHGWTGGISDETKHSIVPRYLAALLPLFPR